MISITATTSYNIKSFFKDVAIFFVIIIAVYYIAALIQQRSIDSYSWWVPGFLFFLQVYRLLDKRRTLHIMFDDTSHQIIIHYKTLISKPEEKRIPFESARLEIVSRRPKDLPKAIYFLRGKTEVYEIKRKEELSQEQLIDIVEAATKINIPIEKV
jgi:hypothetical protein